MGVVKAMVQEKDAKAAVIFAAPHHQEDSACRARQLGRFLGGWYLPAGMAKNKKLEHFF